MQFGNVPANSFTIVSDSLITATIADGATGYVSLGTPGGYATVYGFTYVPPPAINSFSPVTASTNYPVTITGTNFYNVTAVRFGGVPAASFTVNSPSSITAIVGSGTSGDITVTTWYGTGSDTGFIFILL